MLRTGASSLATSLRAFWMSFYFLGVLVGYYTITFSRRSFRLGTASEWNSSYEDR